MWVVKTIRFHLPVLALGETSDLLDLVTSVAGVAAALVDVDESRLDVVVESDACGLLVREELRSALEPSAAA